jgi:hypothetical protein
MHKNYTITTGSTRFTENSIHSLDTGVGSWETSETTKQQSSDEIESIDTISDAFNTFTDYYHLPGETQQIKLG